MLTPESWQPTINKILSTLPQMGSGLLVFLGFWVASVIVRKIVQRLAGVQRLNADLIRFFGQMASTAVLVVGVISALGTAGIDVSALVAGLGLTGFALGFALKDVVSNLMAGVLILMYRPFNHGDHIKVSSFEGRVEQIDLRYTMLDAGTQRICVPNSMLFTNAITVERMTGTGPAAEEVAVPAE
ncbi:MAG: mechanosensitive ion channel [Planctomycetaceae bacterium]|nr:mechanosensitive ion channel [Planctomycetaceae bacterium]